jgi:hypothetical protein
LARDARGVWETRDEHDVGGDLSRVYGFPVDVRAKMAGFGAVARALQSGNIAKAQVAALLLRLPDPLPLSGAGFGQSRERRLHELVACGLLKADSDWEDKHPRTGSPPNPGWFARKPGETPQSEPPKAAAKPNESASPGGRKLAFAGADSLLAENLSRIALVGLARLAARVSVATVLFDAIFIPSANPVVEEGPVPGRPDMTYRWAHDTAEVTFSALVDGEWRIFAADKREGDVFRGQEGEIIARIVPGLRGRGTLLTSLADLDRAIAAWRSANGQPAARPTDEDDEPNLCPAPKPEPKTTKSANSIAYQEYVSKLPYGLAVLLWNVRYDGCDPRTGDMLEAKADIDFMFDENDKLYEWVDPKSNPRKQMERQAKAALAVGRIVVWHAQTEKGYRGLKKIADKLAEPNLFVVYDPN